jgi:3'(2'), 5'-bisphosphate nucleotidase
MARCSETDGHGPQQIIRETLSMFFIRETQIATQAVIEAAQLCRAVRTEVIDVDTLQKGDKSPVTIADFGSQALVCKHVVSAFPNDTIVGEEDASDLRREENAQILSQVTDYVNQFYPEATSRQICEWIDCGNGDVSERYWTLDPIDGTKGFLRNDQYAIALALVESGKVQVGVLACPALPLHQNTPDDTAGVLFVAVRNEGTTMTSLDGGTPNPLRLASDAEPKMLRFVESVESAHGDHALQQTIARAVGIAQDSLRMDSQAKYGAVARGDAALYLRLPSKLSPDYREKVWDHAAGTLIVEEAGGKVTDMTGQPLDFASNRRMCNNRGVVVSNGMIHTAVIEALALHGEE